MRQLLSALTLLTLAAIPCVAQSVPHGDVAAGYTYYYSNDSSGDVLHLNGGSFGGAYNFTNWIAAAADATVERANDAGTINLVQTYTAGPRFSYRKHERFVPFAETLVGYARNSLSGDGPGYSLNAFALNVSLATDIALDPGCKFALRPQVGYALFANQGTGTNAFRASASLVYNIGQIDKK